MSGDAAKSMMIGPDPGELRRQLMQKRQVRTLDLRRMDHGPSSVPKRNKVNLSAEMMFYSTECVEILKGREGGAMEALCSKILKANETCPYVLNEICECGVFVRALVEALQNAQSPGTAVAIMEAFSIVFGRADELQNEILDEGLCDVVLQVMEKSPALVVPALALLGSMVDSCLYARDTIFCLGINNQIGEMALSAESVAVCDAACGVIRKLFSDPESMDRETLNAVIRDVVPLLQVRSVNGVLLVLNALRDIVRLVPGTAFFMHDAGIVEYVMVFLGKPELAETTLKLVGYLCNAPPPQVKAMVEAGLHDRLMQLLAPEYITEVFWVLSNCVQIIPNSVIPQITDGFIQQVVDIAGSCHYDCLKEAAYFLATMMLFTDIERLGSFMRQDIIDVVVKMICCDVHNIVVRCLRGISRMFEYAQKTGQIEKLLELISNSDFNQMIEEVLENEPDIWIDESMSLRDFAQAVSTAMDSAGK